MTDVLAVETPNHPGGLNAIFKPLKDVSINVNYLYTCLGTGEKTVLIVGVDKMEEATQVLKRIGFICMMRSSIVCDQV
jgi:hypothetical protein